MPGITQNGRLHILFLYAPRYPVDHKLPVAVFLLVGAKNKTCGYHTDVKKNVQITNSGRDGTASASRRQRTALRAVLRGGASGRHYLATHPMLFRFRPKG